MKIDSEHLSVAKLFDDFLFIVPKYQRSYAWDEPEIIDFLDDIDNCYVARNGKQNRQHFFGGIVSVGEVKPTGKPECALVDGQQRLATIVMFASNLISFYKSLQVIDRVNKNEFEEILNNRISGIENTYIRLRQEIRKKFEDRTRLILSGPDDTFFRQLTHGLPALTVNKDGTTRDSHRKLQSAYAKISSYLSKKLEKCSTIDAKLDVLESYQVILEEDFTVLHMITRTENEAYRLFQVLNDRGKNLTEGDLLRARTLEMLENFPAQQRLIINAWNDILSDKSSDTDNFLRWYYSSVKAKRPKNAQLLDDFLEDFFPISQDAVNPVAKSLTEAEGIVNTVNQLQDGVRKCRLLIEGEWPFEIAKPITKWHRSRLQILVTELKHTNCMPLLLAACQLKPKTFSQIIQLLERFVFRYITICKAHVNPLTSVYLKHSAKIRSEREHYNVRSLENDLRELQESRAKIPVFESALNELSYTKEGASNKPLKYFLITIENYSRWYNSERKGSPEYMDDNIEIDFASTEIEHIYPQDPDVPNAELDLLTHALGNLTILGSDNGRLRNTTDFRKKIAIYEGTGLYINKLIAEFPAWDSTAVKLRQQRLVDMAKVIFSI